MLFLYKLKILNMRLIIFICCFPLFLIGQTSVEKGKAFIQQKLFSKAEAELKPFVDNNENDLEAIELLGDAYGHQKK